MVKAIEMNEDDMYQLDHIGGRQGDLGIRQIVIPEDAVPQPEDQGGGHIVAHSETGHHHRVLAWLHGDDTPSDVAYLRPMSDEDGLTAYLRVGPGPGAVMVHERGWDTHAPIHLPPGEYRLRRQREYTPEGWRRVED